MRYGRDVEDVISRKVEVQTPKFDELVDPKPFNDWLADMDHYFEWYEMSEHRWVRFSKMKLVGEAKIYWINVERQIERVAHEAIMYWNELKEKLREKYLPITYKDHLMDELILL